PHRTPGLHWPGTIPLGGCPLAQSLVWANPIVYSNPTVCAPLLRPQMTRNPLGRFGLEHPVHLFVGSVLFRVPRRYEFDSNPQDCPPSAQARKPLWPLGTDGLAVLRAVHCRGTV